MGKSCPFSGSLRLMQKVLGKARVCAWGDSGETRGEAGAGWLQRGPRWWPETGPEGGRKPGTEKVGDGGWPGYRHPNYKKRSLIFCSLIFFRAAAHTGLRAVTGTRTKQHCRPAQSRSLQSSSGPGPPAATEPIRPQPLLTTAGNWGHCSRDRKGAESSWHRQKGGQGGGRALAPGRSRTHVILS